MNTSDKAADDGLNYDKLLQDNPWIIEKEQRCVISPDFDGFLCALLMTNILDWQVKGFYDGKILLIDKDTKARDAVFLDIEIFRNGVRSIGQHMLLPHKNHPTDRWANFDACISPNNLRGSDAHHHFQQKYPLATIHFLLSVIEHKMSVETKDEIVASLLFADGTFKNLLGYPENCLSWLEYTNANNSATMNKVLRSRERNLTDTMELMRDFFSNIRYNCGGSRGAEKLKLANTSEATAGRQIHHKINQDEKEKTQRLLKMLSNDTGWGFIEKNWTWDNMNRHEFTKEILQNTTSYQARNSVLQEKAPLSYAITATNRMEYTLISDEQEELFR